MPQVPVQKLPARPRPAMPAVVSTDDPAPDHAGRVLRQFRIVFNAVKTHF